LVFYGIPYLTVFQSLDFDLAGVRMTDEEEAFLRMIDEEEAFLLELFFLRACAERFLFLDLISASSDRPTTFPWALALAIIF
jgi:hypothetical protein